MASAKSLLKQLETMIDSGGEIQFKQNHELPFEIGGAYFIRTVTYFATGRVKDIVGKFLVLEEAAWIADTGRFSDAMAKGVMREVEPIEGAMFLNTDSITDAFPFTHKLPREQK